MEIIDLSHTLYSSMPVYPNTAEAEIEALNTIANDGFNEKYLKFGSHTGTHIDCPAHFFEQAYTTDTMPLEQFYGKGLVIDCRTNDSPKIESKMVASYRKYLKNTDFVLFLTDWSKYWGTEKYFGNFPTPTNDVIEELLEAKIKGIGIDSISIDPMNDTVFQNHTLLLSCNTLIIENLTNLHELLDRNFIFSCFPLKIVNGDGSPVRAVGIVE